MGEASLLAPPAAATRSRPLVWVLGLTAAAGLLCLAFRGVDVHRVTALLHSSGRGMALLLVPTALALGLETVAWQAAFAVMGQRPPFWPLLAVRLGSESVGAALPLGAIW